MANMTAREQLMLELINRARMDPVAEAEHLGVTLAPGQSKPVQVLAGNDMLRTAAYNHSGWMLLNDVFASTQFKGSQSFIAKTALDRMMAYGYKISGQHVYGENISWVGADTVPDFTQAIFAQHATLFADGASRARILRSSFQEVGIGQQAGGFIDGGQPYVASMVTQDFMRSGSKVFITGVIYSDTTDNDFYDVGEGVAARRVAAKGAPADIAGPGGGYELQFGATGIATMKVALESVTLKLDVALGSTNVKVDVVNGNEIWTNGSVQSKSAAITELHALGRSPLVLIGSNAAEEVTGNSAANQLLGQGGNDMIVGGAGKDRLVGGMGGDTLTGGDGADRFIYSKRGESAAAPDIITDFGNGADRIDLSDLSAGKLKYRGEGPFAGGHEVSVSAYGAHVLVHVNLDRDLADEMVIVLANVSLSELSKGDFIL